MAKRGSSKKSAQTSGSGKKTAGARSSIKSAGTRGREAPAASPQNLQPGRTPVGGKPSGPLVAAYDSGRLLNRLDWHAQQAWLLPFLDSKEARQHAVAVRGILTSLPAKLGPALSTAAGDRLHDDLLSRRDEWNSLFNSPGHLSEIEDAAQLLQRELAWEGDLCPSILREESWFDALRDVRKFTSAVSEWIWAELNETCQRALRLGRWIDRGVRPRAVYRLMCRWARTDPPQSSPQPSGGIDPWSVTPGNTSQVGRSAVVANETPPVLYPVVPGTIPLEQGWLEQVRRCWDDMGLSGAIPEHFAPREAQTTSPPTDEGVFSFVDDLDRLVRYELGERTLQDRIPPDERTRPMSLKEAASLMGWVGRKAAEQLRASMDSGAIKYERLSRQSYVFSRTDFPEEVWGRLIRTDPK
jgi:hypothetical protein